MDTISKEQIRQFRLHTQHLDSWYQQADLEEIVGACGFQNTPPGNWEIALRNRIPDYRKSDMRRILEVERNLLQAWSLRGVPLVFPASESDTFLSALIPEEDEPWIYTQGIQLALDFLQMGLEELLRLLKQVLPKLDGELIKSKTRLDQTLAEWVLTLLPEDKKDLWNKPSMYGNPDKQTVGGAVVSFLLRPCAFMGLVVFGKREGISPTFTSYRHWTGHSLEAGELPGKNLAKKYLHCYGPGSLAGFANWLGSSEAQAKRLWDTILDEIEPVRLSGKENYILSADRELLLSPPQAKRRFHFLGAHDPYLGLQDRELILDDRFWQREVWRTVSNPGVILYEGGIAGMWRARKKGKGLEIHVSLREGKKIPKSVLGDWADEYAFFQGLRLEKIIFSA